MSSVDKANVIFTLAQLFDGLLFFLAVVPQKAEIAADNQGVACFERFKFRRRKPFDLTVGVARDINQNFSHPLNVIANVSKICYT